MHLLSQTMLSKQHMGTDPAPRLVAQNLCVREGSQPSLLFTPLLQTQEDAAAWKFSLCLACLWGPAQNEASVYVPCLSPSKSTPGRSPSRAPGCAAWGWTQRVSSWPTQAAVVCPGRVRQQACPRSEPAPMNEGQGGGKLSLCSLVGPRQIEGGPVSKGWGLSLCTAAALRLTWASSQWKGMGCF